MIHMFKICFCKDIFYMQIFYSVKVLSTYYVLNVALCNILDSWAAFWLHVS